MGPVPPLLFLFVVVAAPAASAHVIAPETPLSDVLHHPAFEPVHALAFVGAGLWAGQQPGRRSWGMIAALAAGVVVGIVLAKLAWLPPWRSPVTFAGIAALGITTALRWRPSLAIGAPLCAVVGLYHGVIGSIPEFMGGSGHNPAPDIAVAAAVLSVLARELSARARPPWARIVVRVVGSWIAAAILLLAFTLRIHLGLGVGP